MGDQKIEFRCAVQIPTKHWSLYKMRQQKVRSKMAESVSVVFNHQIWGSFHQNFTRFLALVGPKKMPTPKAKAHSTSPTMKKQISATND
jgi:hypothetical protein